MLEEKSKQEIWFVRKTKNPVKSRKIYLFRAWYIQVIYLFGPSFRDFISTVPRHYSKSCLCQYTSEMEPTASTKGKTKGKNRQEEDEYHIHWALVRFGWLFHSHKETQTKAEKKNGGEYQANGMTFSYSFLSLLIALVFLVSFNPSQHGGQEHWVY